MRFLPLCILFFCAVGTSNAQRVDYLDHSDIAPRERVHKPTIGTVNVLGIVGGSLGVVERPPLFKVTLKQAGPPRTDAEGRLLPVELDVENQTSTEVVIPWSPHSADVEPEGPPDSYSYSQLVVLFYRVSKEEEQTLQSGEFSLFGSSGNPETTKTLAPGQRVTIRLNLRLSAEFISAEAADVRAGARLWDVVMGRRPSGDYHETKKERWEGKSQPLRVLNAR